MHTQARLQNGLLYNRSSHIWMIFHILLITKVGVAIHKYGTIGNKRIQGGSHSMGTLQGAFTSIHTRSKIDCSVHCSSSEVCRSSSYDTVIQVCVLDDGRCRLSIEDSNNAVFMSTLQQPDLVWIPSYDGHCYIKGDMARSWINAETDCKQGGGHLVKIDDANKQAWLEQLLIGDPAVDKIWIGANDIAIEGQWVWISDNTTASYTNWKYNEPNNKDNNQHCAVVREDWNFEWTDRYCKEAFHYFCEK